MCQLCAMRGYNIHNEDFIAEGSSSGGDPPAAPTTFASIATLADYLINGYWAYADYQGTQPRSWASNTISVNMTDLTGPEQALAATALDAWADVCNVTFTFTSGAANITYVNDNNADGDADAYTDQVVFGPFLFGATVLVSSTWGGGAAGGIDGYYYQTLVHETGHALGLGHQGPYNGSANYNTDALWTNDSWRWSVMSYFDQVESDAGSYAYVLTPQMADIYAVQQIYGAVEARAGGTIYGFNSNAGPLYSFGGYVGTEAFTIYDTGGTDVLNAQDYWQDQSIDLHGGSWSSIGGEENNIGIYTDTVIENAVGGSGDDQILGNDVANVLKGAGGADMIKGYGGDDTLSGGGGDDRLEGIDGADTLLGDANNDSLMGGAGADTLNGGSGIDTADYTDSNAAVTVILPGTGTSTGNGGTAEGDTLDSIENLEGSDYGDTLFGDQFVNVLKGNDGDDLLKGGGGADVLSGGAGNDTASYLGSGAGVQVNVSDPSGTGGDAQGDNLTGIENLIGSNHDDTLTGSGGANELSGQDGADILKGGGGTDTLLGGDGNDRLMGGLGGDTLNGGAGVDTATYADSNAAVSVALGGSGDGGTAEGDTLTGIENLVGSAYGDALIGDGNANDLRGGGAVDTLKGGGGADTLDGGAGNDTMLGGAGSDFFYVDSAGDTVNEEVGEGTADRVFASVSYTLGAGEHVEKLTTTDNAGTAAINLTGNEFANTIFGNAGSNTLDGKGGIDTLLGMGGDDFYFVDNAADAVFEGAGQGNDRVFTSINYTLGAGQEIEKLGTTDNAGFAPLNLTGNEFANTIYGNAGSNALKGGLGNDTLVGFGGADAFVFNTALGAGNVDHIVDFNFNAAGGDEIWLHSGIFTTLVPGALPAGAYRIGTMALDADDRIIYNPTTGELSYDADGLGGAADVRFAVLDNLPNLASTQFFVA